MMRQEYDYEIDEFDTHDVTCGNSCGHFDYLNECCWLSWWHKNEGDHCNYGLVEVDGEIYTPKELEELRTSISRRRCISSTPKVNENGEN